jgi:hypothetical protein
MAGPDTHAEAAQCIALLSDGDAAVSPRELLSTDRRRLSAPGLYSWWVDDAGAVDLSRGLGEPVTRGLIYAGLAGATRWPSGKRSSNTLWGRLSGMHLGGRHDFSTFRLSLGSILAEASAWSAIDEAALTAWMHEHLRVIATPHADADTLGRLEGDVLRTLDPPLNLDKVPRTAVREQLSGLRKRYGKKSRKAVPGSSPRVDAPDSGSRGAGDPTGPPTLAAWHRIVDTRDPALLDELLHADAVFRSPAVHTPQEGKALTTAYLTAALQVLGPTLTYEHQWWDDSSAVLEFTAQLDGLTLHGIDMIRWGADGRVVEFTVMVRTFTGLTKLMELMAAQLSR